MHAEGEVERLEEPGVVDDFKERVSRHNRIDTHINSETMSCQTKSQQGEREVGAEQLIAAGRRNQFSSMERHWRSTHSPPKPYAQ